eukprot:885638_1
MRNNSQFKSQLQKSHDKKVQLEKAYATLKNIQSREKDQYRQEKDRLVSENSKIQTRYQETITEKAKEYKENEEQFKSQLQKSHDKKVQLEKAYATLKNIQSREKDQYRQEK